MAAFTGLGKVFTKSGVKITTDLSECQPDGITIPEIDFCSFQDVVGVKIDDLEANAAGHMEAAGSGIPASRCSN